MGWPWRLVLVRHAESEGNVLGVDERALCGIATHSYKLTETGRKQAEITGRYLQEKFGDFDIYYTSYYTRSKETMSIMYPKAHIYEDPRLAEGQRGIWQTMTEDEIKTFYPGELKRKEREGLYHYRPWGGENWPDMELRIHSFLETLNRDCDGQKVLIVVHGHWLILFQKLIHHFSIKSALDKYRAGTARNASVAIYRGAVNEENKKSRLVLSGENITPWLGKI